MNTAIRAIAIYFALMLILRSSGKRTLAQITVFDFVLILMLGDATQQALLGDDYSITTGVLAIACLVALDMTLAYIKPRLPRLDRIIDGMPLVIVEDGKPLRDRMTQCRVDDDDVMAAAREKQGLERMDQIKYAVLERSGGISIIPVRDA
jgi:uncharacterized membrane protein YcaP (DUF421 family)